jgi:3-dehydrosphinganine reductase
MFKFLVIPLILWILFWVLKRRNGINFHNRKVIVIGGTSGLGLSLAKLCQFRGSKVTIAARSLNKLLALQREYGFGIIQVDVTDHGTLKSIEEHFGFVFCCAGASHPGYFKNQSLDIHRKSMNLNYFGTLNVLKHFYTLKYRPFNFVMIGSTLSLWSFPGYSSYSPTKAALNSFYKSVFNEMKRDGVHLYMYYVSTIKSPGLVRENTTKPSFTKNIEGTDYDGYTPEIRAETLLRGMTSSHEIVSDMSTRLLKVRSECDCLLDFLLAPLSFIIFPFWKFL